MSPVESRADVLIVGGGPAGCRAAWCLARRGARVRLFDHSHPREKPCGGGVTGRALALIAGAVDRGALDGVPINAAVFEDPRTEAARITLEDPRSHRASLLVVARREFDLALLDAARAAGVEHHAERALEVSASSDGVSVRTRDGRYEGDWLIGADGANSLVRRRLQRPFGRAQISIAAGVFAHGVTDSAITVRFIADPPGYLWSFPRRDHLAVGICAQADDAAASDLRALHDSWLASSRLAAGATLERYGWPIPSLSALDLASEHPAGDRYLLAGDAAGLVDPITREGIYFALVSGERAAEAIADARDPARRYVEALGDEIYPELMRAARLKQGFFRGSFTRLLVDALRVSPAVRAVMVDLVSGEQSYRTLKRRLVATLEWRLAWQLLRLELDHAIGRAPAMRSRALSHD